MLRPSPLRTDPEGAQCSVVGVDTLSCWGGPSEWVTAIDTLVAGPVALSTTEAHMLARKVMVLPLPGMWVALRLTVPRRTSALFVVKIVSASWSLFGPVPTT